MGSHNEVVLAIVLHNLEALDESVFIVGAQSRGRTALLVCSGPVVVKRAFWETHQHVLVLVLWVAVGVDLYEVGLFLDIFHEQTLALVLRPDALLGLS